MIGEPIGSRAMLSSVEIRFLPSFDPPPPRMAVYSPNFKLVPEKWCHPHRHRYTTSDSLPFRLVLLYLEKSRALRFTSDQLCTLVMIVGGPFSNCRSLVRECIEFSGFSDSANSHVILNDENPKIVFYSYSRSEIARFEFFSDFRLIIPFAFVRFDNAT